LYEAYMLGTWGLSYSIFKHDYNGADGETRTLTPLQMTGFQDQTDTNFWLRLQLDCAKAQSF